MGLPFVFWVVIFLAFQAQVAWSHIRIQPARSQGVQTGSNVTFVWSRDKDDPNKFFVGKHMHHNNTLPQSEVFFVHTHNLMNGTFNTSFHSPGKFHLLAFPKLESNATEINVNNLTKVYKSPGINVLAANSTASADTSTHPSGSQVSVIIAVCLGSTLLAVIILFIIYIFLRRRRRRLAAANRDSHYAFANSSAPSPTPSRTWLLQKIWPSSRDHTSTVNMTTKGDDRGTAWPDTLNFYHTPRPPPAAVMKKSPSPAGGTTVISNGTDTSLSSMQFSANTERQIEIDARIEELNGKLSLLQKSFRMPDGRPDSRTLVNMTHNMRIGKWRNQIERLQELKSSDWALGRTDVVPKGLYGPQSIV